MGKVFEFSADDFVNERTTAIFAAIFKRVGDKPLLPLSVDSLTVTLFARDLAGKPVINSRLDQNVLNANGGVLQADGCFRLLLVVADNIVMNSALSSEVHRLSFKWTYLGGTRTGRREVDFTLRNLSKLGTVCLMGTVAGISTIASDLTVT